jgi:2'-5' RNA ligase
MPTAPQLWRVFCAIELPQKVCENALNHINKLRAQFPQVRASWTSSGKFHLTLKFLAEIHPERVEALSTAAALAAASQRPFPLNIEGCGAFPERGPAKVLWAGINDSGGGLAQFQLRLENECAKEGFAKESRAFHPHLTLARLRESRDARSLSSLHKEIGFAAQHFIVSELLVIRSELSSAGSKYTTISRHALTG